MPVDRLEPLGQVQKIPEITINSRIVDRANEPHYTCPAGKKAVFKGIAQCTSVGAATLVNIRDPTDSFNIVTWKSSGGAAVFGFNGGLAVDMLAELELELEAGDEIKSTQNAGTNAEVNIIGKILELDA